MPRELRVRTGKHYPIRFCIDVGQENVRFTRRALTPLGRYFRSADAFCVLEPGYDLIHSYNAIPLFNRTPYVVTFEDYFPRVPDDRHIAWLHHCLARRAAAPLCRRIIAESRYALRQFEAQNRGMPWYDPLKAKMQLLLPAIAARPEGAKARMNETLKLVFVGVDFMRKGLTVLLKAHAALLRAGVPVETVVISTLRWSPQDYIGPASRGIVEETLRLLDQQGVSCPAREAKMPNAQVLEAIRAADFLVLPTFHDTFGYVSLEAMAMGTPVIATATCAQPEIIDDGLNGRLLAFDNDDVVGKWRWLYRKAEPGYEDAFRSEVERLGEELTQALQSLWEERAGYAAMSEAAIAKIRTSFDPGAAARTLEDVYRAALA